jgi:hypothetical protein
MKVYCRASGKLAKQARRVLVTDIPQVTVKFGYQNRVNV